MPSLAQRAEELRKLLTHPNRARGVRLLRGFELVEPVLPELVPTFDLPCVTASGAIRPLRTSAGP